MTNYPPDYDYDWTKHNWGNCDQEFIDKSERTYWIRLRIICPLLVPVIAAIVLLILSSFSLLPGR